MIPNEKRDLLLSSQIAANFILGRKRWHFETMDARVPCAFGRLPSFQQGSICQLEYFHAERATTVEHVVAAGIFTPAPGREIAPGTS